jgi:hypothetical protein
MRSQPAYRPDERVEPPRSAAPPDATWQSSAVLPVVPASEPTMLMHARPEPAFAWLVAFTGPGAAPILGQALPLQKLSPTSLGRTAGNDLVVADPACSSRHVKIVPEPGEAGQTIFVIYDLASANGLYVGDKQHYRDDGSRTYRHVLHDGEYILIGETIFVFKQV